MPRTNEPGVRLRDLQILDVILRACSLTRAAEQLDTTQPTISKVLARLRAQFHDPLLVRDGHAMKPTPRAAEIVTPLRALLVAADGIRTPARGPFVPGSSDRMFRLLLTDVGMIRFLPPLTARLAAAGPHLQLEAVPLDSRHFEAKLASGDADLALGAFPRAPRGLRRRALYVDRYVSVARRAHPQLDRLRSAAGFRKARHILVTASETGHGAHEVVQGHRGGDHGRPCAAPAAELRGRRRGRLPDRRYRDSPGEPRARSGQAAARRVPATARDPADRGRAVLARAVPAGSGTPLAAADLRGAVRAAQTAQTSMTLSRRHAWRPGTGSRIAHELAREARA